MFSNMFKNLRFFASSSRLRPSAIGVASFVAVGFVSHPPYKKYYSPTESLEARQIKEYCERYYSDLNLSKEEIEQLSWLQNNTVATSESSGRLLDESVFLNIEIRRALARLNCLNLLQDGSLSAYQTLVEKQSGTNKLTYLNFKKLSDFIKMQSNAAQQALKASCFITISDKSKSLAKGKEIKFSSDSEKFLTDTITQCPEIYPTYQASELKTKRLFSSLFLKNSHARHMLYTEGGDNMFAELQEKIKKEDITKEEYDLWFSRWIINIAGFRGHEEPLGSVYLTQNTFDCIFALKQELDKLWENPEHDVLGEYLKIRANWLGVNNIFLAHIGSMMRLHGTAEGKELQRWFDTLPESTRKSHEEAFRELRHSVKVTPTFEPAVLDNLRSLGCDIFDVITIHTQIKLAASQTYRKKIMSGEISDTTPLCFRSIALKENLTPIIDFYKTNGTVPDINVTSEGDVTMQLALKMMNYKV